MTQASLLVIQGANQGARFELADTPVLVGRGVRNAIRILDTEVSRHHAEIDYADGDYRIRDCDSSNGTFVNGQPIQSAPLRNGDQIQIGCSVLVLTTQATQDAGRVRELIELIGHDRDDRSSIVGRITVPAMPNIPGGTIAGLQKAATQTMTNLHAIYRISEVAVSSTGSIDQILNEILKLTIDAVGAHRGCMLLIDSETGELTPRVYSSPDDPPGGEPQPRMPVSRTIVEYVRRNGQGVRTSDARSDDRFEPGKSIVAAGIREAICAPMQGHAELLGVVYIDTTTRRLDGIETGVPRDKFSEEHLKLVLAIGRQAALVVERDRYERALVKAERFAAIGQTIAILSHHIKNILQGVRGGSYLIEMGIEKPDNELVRNGWRIVERNQRRIYNLVMDMLSFSTEREPALETADLNEVVNEVRELMVVPATERGVNLTVEFGEIPDECMFDREGMHRAVLNLVINAIEAVEGCESGRVLIATGCQRETQMLTVTVADNGPGIPEDQLPSIFNIFASNKGAVGTGIGLAVSQKIIQEHGGRVEVRSQAGQGTEFTLTWPRIEDEPLGPEDPAGRQ